ncbi:B3 domain-containing protein Os01g0905400-like [Arachis stenosperma]|uniref:B3 domain-containing protein Os01g0905400-like n=1 Tax=Arachis stenosperma TaxID=217475 RepID=UPI0025AD9594|nr:B3 domain-containing protein Os01g0905400-like [Arachis stenosperma]
MRPEALVCEECACRCVLLHGNEKKKSSLFPPSFFKIMFDSNFSTIMYLPDKFKPAVAASVNKKIILDDKSGERWKVTLSKAGSHLAFKEGWNKFSSDHGLERGDILVFHHVTDVHFYVTIYDKYACEKLCCSNTRNKTKRRRDSSVSPVRDVMLATPDQNASVVSEPDAKKTNSQNKVVGVGGTPNNVENISKHDKSNGSVKSTRMTENYDSTAKITARESRVSPVNYKLCMNPVDAILCDNSPSFEERFRGAAAFLSEAELSGKRDSIRNTDRSTYDNTSTCKLGERKEKNVLKREVREFQYTEDLEGDNKVAMSKKEHGFHIDGCLNTKPMFNATPNISDATRLKSDPMATSKGKHGLQIDGCPNTKHIVNNGIPRVSSAIQNGKILKKIKSEQADRNPSEECTFKDKVCAKGEMPKRIKKEPRMDMTYNVSRFKDEFEARGIEVPKGLPKVIKKEFEKSSHKTEQNDDNDDDSDNVQLAEVVRCVVPDHNDKFLELPTNLHQCRNYKNNRMVVILRDPQRRLWPVLYHDLHDKKMHGTKAFYLIKGWSQFYRANNIQPGDLCTFELKEEAKHIFNVDINHN